MGGGASRCVWFSSAPSSVQILMPQTGLTASLKFFNGSCQIRNKHQCLLKGLKSQKWNFATFLSHLSLWLPGTFISLIVGGHKIRLGLASDLMYPTTPLPPHQGSGAANKTDILFFRSFCIFLSKKKSAKML